MFTYVHVYNTFGYIVLGYFMSLTLKWLSSLPILMHDQHGDEGVPSVSLLGTNHTFSDFILNEVKTYVIQTQTNACSQFHVQDIR